MAADVPQVLPALPSDVGAAPTTDTQQTPWASAFAAVSNAQGDQANSGAGSGSIPEPPQLHLPKGGGAIQGMGEKFDVDSSTGTASVSIPIRTSPGRSEVQPHLQLSY